MIEVRIPSNLNEWTICRHDCACCLDPLFGHNKPHDAQYRIYGGKSASQVREELSKLPKLEKLTKK